MNDNSVEKILILAANPLNAVHLSLDREVDEIRNTLRLSANRDRFTIETRGAVRPSELQQYMYDLAPQIVHFSGHGVGLPGSNSLSNRKLEVVTGNDSPPEGLVFVDDDGRSKLVSGQAISNLFALFKDGVVCVVLNACYSHQQAEEIRKYIPYVVGMNQEIGDLAARKFSVGFYRAIWDGRSIEEAFASGKNAIELDGIPEELIPVLLKRADLPKSSYTAKPNLWRLVRPLQTGLFVSVGATVAISFARFLGVLQPLELTAYDLVLQSRSAEIQDKNVLVIEVNGDSRPDKSDSKKTLSDDRLDKLLQLILPYEPKIIGFDNFLNNEVDSQKYETLYESLKTGNLVAVCKAQEKNGDDFKAPDSAISVGFGNIIVDNDKKVRRHLLSMDFNSGSCTQPYALSALLVIQYLEDTDQKLQLARGKVGKRTLNLLGNQTGGYWRLDANSKQENNGYQTMLNYRFNNSLRDGVNSSSIDEIFKLPPQELKSKIENHIVLIGTTEGYYPDSHETPYGKIPGVFLQAQMTSQLLNAALYNRPLIWAYPFWVESLMILLASVTGALLSWRVRKAWVLLVCGGGVVAMLFFVSVGLLQVVGYWFPFVPTLLGFSIVCTFITIYLFREAKPE
jgi:CHASE2 domain-containing sensor protein